MGNRTVRAAARADGLDRKNLAEELDTLARALDDELFRRLLQHLLKRDYLPLVRPPAWYIAIHKERGAIPLLLADAPSLRSGLQSA